MRHFLKGWPTVLALLILGLATLTLRPALRILAPGTEARVVYAFESRSMQDITFYWRDLSASYGPDRDPWGRVWTYNTEADGECETLVRLHSRGLDGIDESGAGDDILIYDRDLDSAWVFSWAELGYIWLPDLFFVLAMLVLAAAYGLDLVLAPRGSRACELALVLSLAIPLTTLSMVGVVLSMGFGWAEMLFYSLLSRIPFGLHPFVALALLLYAAFSLMILWGRGPRRLPSSWSRSEAFTFAVCLVLAVHAPLIQDMWGRSDPFIRTFQVYTEGDAFDPWGRGWSRHPEGTFHPSNWSVGPNGVDEEGRGDDIVVDYAIYRVADHEVFLNAPRLLLGVAAALLVMSCLYHRLLLPRLRVMSARRWLARRSGDF